MINLDIFLSSPCFSTGREPKSYIASEKNRTEVAFFACEYMLMSSFPLAANSHAKSLLFSPFSFFLFLSLSLSTESSFQFQIFCGFVVRSGWVSGGLKVI